MQFAVPCIAGLAASCNVHDDFPDRVRRGCNSERECVLLIGAARYRLLDCVTSGRSSRGDTSLFPDWHLVEGVCSYEYADFLLAVRKGRQWAAGPKFTPHTSGEMLPTSVQVLEPSADGGPGVGRAK
jgi:hypothetical protein